MASLKVSIPRRCPTPRPPIGNWFYTSAAIVLSLLALEQTVYRYKKRHLPGSKWTIPIIRQVQGLGYMAQWKSGALSALSVFNIFIVMASTNEYARKILNSPPTLNPALSAAKDGQPKPIMMTARDLNMETSLRVFCGNHIPEDASKEISEKYWDITRALELVNFPLAFPGTKVYSAIQARKVAMKWLEFAARKSKESIAAGNPPECMLEEWVQILNEPTYKGRRDFTDNEMAMVVFSFLFASQDAMSSGRVRRGDNEKPLTLEMMDQMPYLRAMVKETLHHQAFPISEDYTVPSGSMVIPAFYLSLHDQDVYPEPEKFLPERWLDPESSANTNPKNYLVFGSGPHKCIGLEYAMMNIGLVLADAAVLMDWEHVTTPESEKVQIIATLFPKDGCLLKLTPRQQQ
ncbi:cytochrome P450 [Irpex lacteus]|nr:cytochrome P450 [Irpex lacteus]